MKLTENKILINFHMNSAINSLRFIPHVNNAAILSQVHV